MSISNEERGRVAVLFVALFVVAQVGLSKISIETALAAPNVTVPNDPMSAMRYEVVDLGIIPSIAADVTPGLSPSGNTVTWQQGDTQAFSAVLYDGKAKKLLPHPNGYRNSFACSINDRGNSVGWSNTTLNPVDSASTLHATFFGKERVVDLGTLGGLRSQAYAINSNDVIVGVSELADRQERAFRYADGKMMPLDPLPGGRYSVAFDINDAGTIVGSATMSSGLRPVMHAVIWRGNNPRDLGTLYDKGSSIAYAINNNDEVVGVSAGRSEETVFLYSDGKMRDLGIDGYAHAINDRRQIVGTLRPEERGRPSGFLWENGTLYNVNSLIHTDVYWVEAAYRINNRGQILCVGFGDGHMHALLLNPIY